MNISRMILNFLLFITLFIANSTQLRADNRIIIYLNNAPEGAINSAEAEYVKELKTKKIVYLSSKTPAQMSQKILKNELKRYMTPNLGGFIALYAGYIDYSSNKGLISFPLRHEAPKLYLAITPSVELVRARGNTVSHQKYMLNVPTKIYLFEKKQDKNKQFFWHVSEDKVPANRIVSPLTTMLLTKPKNVFVTLGDFISNDSKHIILPDNIYALGISGNNKILLNSLNTNLYFESIKYMEKKISEIIYQKMIANL